MRSTHPVAAVVSEVAGPAPLLAIGLLQIGIPERSYVPTAIAIITMAVAPYLATILMSRAGKVGDRFIADRSQRMPFLVGTLVVVILGLVAMVLLEAPASLVLVAVAAVCALLIVTGITLYWKISIHTTIAAFFAVLQIVLYGPLGALALVIPILVAWARLRLHAHTVAQVAAGAALGATLASGYAAAALFFA
jgi:membrane-associated phospholipid phosphatase